MLLRAITGFFFISIILSSLWFGDLFGVVTMTLFFVLGINEYLNLFAKSENTDINKTFSLSMIILIYIFSLNNFLIYTTVKVEFLAFPLLFGLVLSEIWRKKSNPFMNIGVNVLGVVYLVLPFYFMTLIGQKSTHENPLAIGMFLLIWTNDTFAYLSGRFFGKTKLFERISPKKTWEGTIGGILITVIVAILISFWGDNSDLEFWLISALIIAPCAIFGDLLESLFKRTLNIKDSGTILPGHGGILDRFDAAIFTAPFFYTWYEICMSIQL